MGFSKQRGIALLSALLVVSITTALLVSINHEQGFAIRKTSRLQLLDRARLYALGMEDWARIFLQKDRKDNQIDHLGEDWNVGVPALPIEGGQISGFLEDAQGKFNVNNLLEAADNPEHLQLKRFTRLCQQLEVDTAFIPALIDWLDEDIDVRFPEGAEDDYYAGLESPYRTANALMVDISELRLVKGVSDEMYQALAPHLTALPKTTALNINTISETLYSALDENLDEKKFIDEREQGEFNDMADFSKRMEVNIPQDGLAFATEYFLASGQVSQGDLVLSMNSLIFRNDQGGTLVLNRRLSDF